MRSKFDAQLKELGEKLTLMGAMCEEAIANSAKALLSGDSELAKKLAPLDLEIDRYERDIEALCLRLLLQQQPVARDLRQISAALKMITDLERIGTGGDKLLGCLCSRDVSGDKLAVGVSCLYALNALDDVF